ncbi:MAG: ion transporter [Bacteroidales bacterium]|jgi:voltage-gated potassium channel|nr:ion transporter [Bacteroidales bacterium]
MSVSKLVIALLSIVSIILLTISFFLPVDSELYKLLNYYDYALCAFFLYDFFAELKRSENRWKYFRTYGWIDFLSSVPVIQELRFARLLRIFRVLRIFRTYSILVNFIRSKKKESFYGFSVMLVILIIILSSFMVLLIERNTGNIKTAEDTLWWSLITVTTVGYGDLYPTTGLGRLFATLLIVTGIYGFGAVISYLGDRLKNW